MDCPYKSRRADGDRISRRAVNVAYVSELYRRADQPGKTYAAPEVRFATVARAVAYAERLGLTADVNLWIERRQQREAVGRRYADGRWSLRQVSGAWEPELVSPWACPGCSSTGTCQQDCPVDYARECAAEVQS